MSAKAANPQLSTGAVRLEGAALRLPSVNSAVSRESIQIAMKFLFVTTGSQATFYAVAPLATAVRNAGHQVLMATHEPWIETAEAIGVPSVCYSHEPIRHFMKTLHPGEALRFPSEMGDDAMVGQGRAYARMATAGLGALLDLTKDWRPDLVVGSAMSFAAGLLATHLNVPYVRQAEYLQIPVTGIDPGAEEELLPELERLGLAGLPKPTLFVDATPPSLRPPQDPESQPIRWIPNNPQRRLEPWMYTRPEGRHRVIITSGFRSLMFRTPGWSMPRLVEQLTVAGAEVLIAASPGAAERFGAELGDARVGWIPMDVVAPTCDLVVYHGGGTTATTFMTNGVPQLIIPENPPEFPENFHRKAIARAVSAFGAGMTVWPQRDAPGQDPGEVIAAGAKEVLSTPRYTLQSQAIAAEIATLPTPGDVVHMMEKLAA
jgi:UDP:flavonoid glycosyltransferase YjiC (YdhE family)